MRRSGARRWRSRAARATCAVLVAALPGVAVLLSAVVGVLVATVAPSQAQTTGNTTFHVSTDVTTVFSRVDLPVIELAETTVVGVFDGKSVFSQSADAAPDAPAVQDLLDQARSAVLAAGAGTVGDPATTTAESTSTKLVSELVTGTQTGDTEVVTTVGPAAIKVGDDLSEDFFVPAGSIDFNAITSITEVVTRTFQDTVTRRVTLTLTGAAVAPPVSEPDPDPPPAPPDPPPSVAPPAAEPAAEPQVQGAVLARTGGGHTGLAGVALVLLLTGWASVSTSVWLRRRVARPGG